MVVFDYCSFLTYYDVFIPSQVDRLSSEMQQLLMTNEKRLVRISIWLCTSLISMHFLCQRLQIFM